MLFFSFFAIIALLIVLSFVWPPDSPWSPWWRTNKKTALDAARLLNLKKSDIVYELGSGDGEFILTAARDFKVNKAIGIEIDYPRFYISQIRKQIAKSKNAYFIRSDFKNVYLSEATVVYFYLVPSVIKRLLPKLKKELKPGTRIVSYKYKASLQLVKTKGNLYLYKI